MERDAHLGFEENTPEKIFKCVEFLLKSENTDES
jgi:hypothetical protein